ncbi:hypothetical protein Golomagni_00113 [Golovinomyces magnicellulatus]|nr:hypothetical protein Golomagni_00113 [Golovinomyces magnicellulatus]
MVRSRHVPRRSSNKSWSYGRGRFHSSNQHFVRTSSQASSHFGKERQSARRKSRITFVSAGTLESDFPKDGASKMNDPRPRPVVLSLTAKTLTSQSSALKLDKGARNEASLEAARSEGFVIDLQGSGPIQTGLSPPTLCPRSPASSDSSDEIILFKGRKSFADVLTGRGLNSGDNNTDDKINFARKKAQKLSLEKSHQTIFNVPDQNALSKSIGNNSNELQSSQPIDLPKFYSTKKSKKQIHDELMADYLANIESEDLNAMLSFTRRDLGGSPGSNYSSLEIESLKDSLSESLHEKLTLDFQDVHIQENASFSLNLNDVVRREYRNKIDSGVTEKTTINSETSSISEIAGLNMYDTLVNISEHYDHEIAKSDCPSSSDQDYSISSISDFSPKKTKDRTVNNLEELFAQYEELEMDSESISHLNELEVINFSNKGSGSLLQNKNKNKKDKKKYTKKTMKGKKKNLPDSGKTLQVYDDIFDVMGFDRPNHKRGKDRKTNSFSAKQMPNFEEYIEMQLQKDLVKKNRRRKEREKSRSLGLLGSKNGNPRMKTRYKDGLSISNLKKELKNFLQSEKDTLVLPPMAKTDRKVVHEIANIFKLKSNSRGNGTKRFATLYRTSHTIRFTDDIFNSLETRLIRRFFPDISPRTKYVSSKKKSQDGSASKIAVSYQDGDIVGGSAPEISADNRGRAMLEKMGWSTGTALGALNNKGILQPVSHVVKTSKAGLG